MHQKVKVPYCRNFVWHKIKIRRCSNVAAGRGGESRVDSCLVLGPDKCKHSGRLWSFLCGDYIPGDHSRLKQIESLFSVSGLFALNLYGTCRKTNQVEHKNALCCHVVLFQTLWHHFFIEMRSCLESGIWIENVTYLTKLIWGSLWFWEYCLKIYACLKNAMKDM